MASIVELTNSFYFDNVEVAGDSTLGTAPAANDIAIVVVADFNGAGNITAVSLDGDAMTQLGTEMLVFGSNFGVTAWYKILDGAETASDKPVLTFNSNPIAMVGMVHYRPDASSTPTIADVDTDETDGLTNGPLTVTVPALSDYGDLVVGLGFTVIAPRLAAGGTDITTTWHDASDSTGLDDVANDNYYIFRLVGHLGDPGAALEFNTDAFTANGSDYVVGIVWGFALGAAEEAGNIIITRRFKKLQYGELPYELHTRML